MKNHGDTRVECNDVNECGEMTYVADMRVEVVEVKYDDVVE